MRDRTLRFIGAVAVLWNLAGVANYLAHVGMFGEPTAGSAMPLAITAAFAVAVWSGLAGSLGLALGKRWSAPVLWVSFIASVINWVWVLRYSEAASVPLGIAVMAIALVLALAAGRLRRGAARR